ncbi:MAG: hypothetical protein NDJ92_03115 [Thermoanaerobaculia bacterium]|nr:hypothetical protein [Thermoanaerobaculia bacterium]
MATALVVPTAPASKKSQLDLAAFRAAVVEFFGEPVIRFRAIDDVESVTALWKAFVETGRPDAAFSRRLHEFYTTQCNRMRIHGSEPFPHQPTFAQLRAGLQPSSPGARSAAERKRERELVRHHLALFSKDRDTDPGLAGWHDLDFDNQTDEDLPQLLGTAPETLRPLLKGLRKFNAWGNVAYFGYYLSNPTLFYEGIQGLVDTGNAAYAADMWAPSVGHEEPARHLAQEALHETLKSRRAERILDVFWAYYWAAVFERRRTALNLPVV